MDAMSSPRPHANDPFETLVELTAAAMSGRPPRDFVYEPAGPSIFARVVHLFERLRRPGGDVAAANDANAGEARLLQRYY
jgi:hypothetical protein